MFSQKEENRVHAWDTLTYKRMFSKHAGTSVEHLTFTGSDEAKQHLHLTSFLAPHYKYIAAVSKVVRAIVTWSLPFTDKSKTKN